MGIDYSGGICTKCGATDASGDNRLNESCGKQPERATEVLLSCAEWHEIEAWSYRQDYENVGDKNTPLGADFLREIEKHTKFATAIREIMKENKPTKNNNPNLINGLYCESCRIELDRKNRGTTYHRICPFCKRTI